MKSISYFKRGTIICILSLSLATLSAYLMSIYSVELFILCMMIMLSEWGFFLGLMYMWNRVSIEMRCKQTMENLFERTRKLKK